MRKTLKIALFFAMIFAFVSILYVITAAPLSTLQISLDKTVVHPGENVTIDFDFGQDLGSFTFGVTYDPSLFEYVSTAGATSTSDSGTTATAVFFDNTGGSNPASGMTMTFMAKTGIATSNPTQFSIQAVGLSDPTGVTNFDDILVPIVKDVLVEPAYIDYNISINYTGDVIKNEEKPIDVTISSTVGRYYDHLRLIAEVVTPGNATMQLLGKDSSQVEHDVILSGWGEATGFGLGGDVDETYHFRGLFSEDGEYVLTLKLIDRDDSDAVIASGTKTIKVGVPVVEELPKEMPKTGINMYVIATAIAAILILGYIAINQKSE
jgi:hypothetical protein